MLEALKSRLKALERETYAPWLAALAFLWGREAFGTRGP
jgi:hypothetical protein